MTAPRWTADAQEWYERWLEKWAKDLTTYVYPATGRRAYEDDEIPHMIAWYAGRPLDFCFWREPLSRNFYPDAFGPPSLDDLFLERPCWKINWEKLKGARQDAFDAAHEAIIAQRRRQRADDLAAALREEAERFPTLEAWLGGLAAGEVAVSLFGHVPEEQYTSDLLETKGMRRLQEMKRRLRARWPRRCKSCGGEFIVQSAGPNAQRCPTCRQQPRREASV